MVFCNYEQKRTKAKTGNGATIARLYVNIILLLQMLLHSPVQFFPVCPSSDPL